MREPLLAQRDADHRVERGLRGPHRQRTPVVGEPVDALCLDAVAERLVGCDALDALGRVGDAGGRTLEDQRRDSVGPVHRDVQRRAATHRVAKPRRSLVPRPADGLDEVVDDATHLVALQLARSAGQAVTDVVRDDAGVVVAQHRCQLLPRGARAGEAMQEHHRRTGADRLDVVCEAIDEEVRHPRRLPVEDRARRLDACGPDLLVQLDVAVTLGPQL